MIFPEPEEMVQAVFHLSFPLQYDMNETFLRFQEYYENPHFRGKVFTLENYIDWEIDTQGKFTYFEKWSGMNVPSETLTPFYDGAFNPLTRKEKALLDLFADQEGRFYVIATHQEKQQNTIQHEVGHGLFYTNPDYRNAALSILSGTDTTPIREFIRNKGGYHEDVLDDETHAYLMASTEKLTKQSFDISPYAEITRQLQQLYKRFTPPNLNHDPQHLRNT